MLIDTHAHLNFSAYKNDLDEVMQRIIDDGMRVINVGSQYSTSERAVKLANEHPGVCYAAIGLHPIHLFDMEVDEAEMPFTTRQEKFSAERYQALARDPHVVAIGEMGLDYFHRPPKIKEEEFERAQRWTFLKGVQLAMKLRLPIILHCRGAKGDEHRPYLHMLKVLKEAGYSRGVLHCFTADWPIAKQFLDAGFMISFTGVITYPKTKLLEEAVKKTPLDRLMVETDAPYLAPQMVRGKRNEPRFVRYVADRVAELKGITYEEVEEQTGKNATEFFRLR
ncbi:MAG: TatD family hydrolase [Patescibacteria group bacterium]|nr:TatD family hydrolase [Patescibacteria group bacterium]MDD5716132.1 TatD family hydrolase [Patescibacteria group bacterium]